MSPQAQRSAIAGACGWEFYPEAGAMPEAWYNPKGVLSHLPNYLSDLNAMHEAEKALSIDLRGRYVHHLTTSENVSMTFDFGVICAAAAQRAEAFLRTLGKWEDDTKVL